MAFTILNNDEISFLTDSQRIQYEKELELYQQRVAFVEHMERLENAHIEPYEPKLETIPVMDKMEVRPFEKIEYVAVIGKPMEKLELEIKKFNNIDKVNPVMPLQPQCIEIKTDHIKRIEHEKPNMPSFNGPHMIVSSFKRVKKQELDLSQKVNVSLDKEIHFEQFKNDLHYKPTDMPNVVMPNIDINSFEMSKNSEVHLPEILISNPEVVMFIKPEKLSVELPKVEEPGINVKKCTINRNVQPKLPDVQVVSNDKMLEFHKPEQKKLEIPTISSPSVNIINFDKTELPELKVPQMELLHDINLEKKIKQFEMPKSKNIEFPEVAEVNLCERTFQKPEKRHTNMKTVVIPSIKTRSFKKQKRENVILPIVDVGCVPDAYERLKEIL